MASKRNLKERKLFNLDNTFIMPAYKKTRARVWVGHCLCGQEIKVKIFQHRVPSSICTQVQVQKGCAHLQGVHSLHKPVATVQYELDRLSSVELQPANA